MSFIQQAFEIAIKDHKTPERWFVCLIGSYQAYGGPEEGGWWYTVSNLEAYKEFQSEEDASEAAEGVKELAEQLSIDARREHGNAMLASLEWLEARGLDADFLPEPDGETKYRVTVCTELPRFDNRRPHYE